MSKSFDRWTLAWLLACIVFAIHIFDEAMNGTFGFYSDLERLVTELLPSLNIVPFNFEVWLVNIAGTLAILFLLTPLVRAQNPLMIPASFLFAAFLSGNSALHLLMAMSRGSLVTGSVTAPLMLAAGLFLFLATASGSARNAQKLA